MPHKAPTTRQTLFAGGLNRPRQLIAKITRSLGSATKIINRLQFLWEKGTCGCKNSLHFTFWPSDDFRRSGKCKSTKLHLHPHVPFIFMHFHPLSPIIVQYFNSTWLVDIIIRLCHLTRLNTVQFILISIIIIHFSILLVSSSKRTKNEAANTSAKIGWKWRFILYDVIIICTNRFCVEKTLPGIWY